MSSKLVFRGLALEVGGRVGEVVRESWKNFDEAVGDVGGRGVETNSRGMSGTGGCSSCGIWTDLGRRRLPLDARWLRVLAAETWLSRVPSIVRILRVLLMLRALFVLFTLRTLRMLDVSATSWLGGVIGGLSSMRAGDIADILGIGDSGDITGRGSTCISVPPSGSNPGLGERGELGIVTSSALSITATSPSSQSSSEGAPCASSSISRAACSASRHASSSSASSCFIFSRATDNSEVLRP